MEYGLAKPEHSGTTKLFDGRQIGWAAWGPPDGRPVLFFGGAAMGRSLGFGADVLGRLGVRLIALERPGLGASDPEPNRVLADWPGDVRQVIAALGLSEVRIVGFSMGAPFALACAAAGLPVAVAIVSGQDDLRHPAFQDLLDPQVAALLDAAAADPDSVEAFFEGSTDADLVWRLIATYSSPVDLAIYLAPAFEAAFRTSLEEGFVQGAAGYARDFTVATGAWPFDVAEIGVPVDLWYGGHDRSTVHSPDHGATMSGRIPGARWHLIPEAGGSLLWTHAEAILTTLLAPH